MAKLRPSSFLFAPHTRCLSVIRLNKVRHRLRLARVVVRAIRVGVGIVSFAVTVTVAMAVVRRSDVLQLVRASALGAPLDRPVAGGDEPVHYVRVGGEARAADVLLVAEGLDDDRVGEGAWNYCE